MVNRQLLRQQMEVKLRSHGLNLLPELTQEQRESKVIEILSKINQRKAAASSATLTTDDMDKIYAIGNRKD